MVCFFSRTASLLIFRSSSPYASLLFFLLTSLTSPVIYLTTSVLRTSCISASSGASIVPYSYSLTNDSCCSWSALVTPEGRLVFCLSCLPGTSSNSFSSPFSSLLIGKPALLSLLEMPSFKTPLLVCSSLPRLELLSYLALLDLVGLREAYCLLLK